MPEAYLQSEKRVDPRFAVRIPIIFRAMDDKDEIKSLLDRDKKEKKAHTLNISLSGMCLVTGKALTVGNVLSLDIMLPGSTRILRAIAEVVWSNETGGGIRFLSMKEGDMQSFKTYLDEVASRSNQ